MKSASLFLLITSLIAILAISEFTYAADDDADEGTSAESSDGAENNEDDYPEDEKEDSNERSIAEAVSYSATISDPKWNSGQCHKDVTVKGPGGIDDVIPVDCNVDNFVLTNNTLLVVGGALYSNTPNILVVVKGVRCEKRTYGQSEGGSATSTPVSANMTPRECAAIRKSMIEIRRQTVADLSSTAANMQTLQNSIFAGNAGNIPFSSGNTGNGLGNIGETNSGNLFGNRPSSGSSPGNLFGNRPSSGSNPGNNFMSNFGF